MKNSYIYLSILLIISLLTIGNYNNFKAEALTNIVQFADENFAKALGEELGKNPNEITIEDLNSITGSLQLQNKNINNIKGAEYLSNIIELNLSFNNIEDLTPIKNLLNLESLNIYENNVKDINAIKSLTNLTTLEVALNPITDFSPISNLVNLEYLFAENCNIKDISFIENLNNIKGISFQNNSIFDLSPLENLSTLKELYLANNEIRDISPLKDLFALRYLNLKNNKIEKVEELNFTTLIYLNLENNYLNDISFLSKIPSLERVFLANNKIELVPDNLSKCVNLIIINLANNKITGTIPTSLNSLARIKYSYGTSEFTSFANNQIVGTIPITLKNKINNANAFKDNFLENETNQKQLIIPDNTKIEINKGMSLSQSLLRNLVDVKGTTLTEKPLYKLEYIPNDPSFFDQFGRAIKSGTVDGFIKFVDIPKTNASVLATVNIPVDDKLGRNNDIDISFTLTETLEVIVGSDINFGRISPYDTKEAFSSLTVISSLPYSIYGKALTDFTGTISKTNIIPANKLSLNIDNSSYINLDLFEKEFSFGNFPTTARTHSLNYKLDNTLGYSKDIYKTDIELIVNTL